MISAMVLFHFRERVIYRVKYFLFPIRKYIQLCVANASELRPRNKFDMVERDLRRADEPSQGRILFNALKIKNLKSYFISYNSF